MVALIVEDGTGKPDATTFASRAELIAFAAARGIIIEDTDAADVFLVQAMDVLLTKSFLGSLVVVNQGAPFPRELFAAPNSDTLVFPKDSVPTAIKRAQILLAVAASQGVTLLDSTSAGRQLRSRELGPLKRTFTDTSLAVAQVAGVDEALAPFLASFGGFRLVVDRA